MTDLIKGRILNISLGASPGVIDLHMDDGREWAVPAWNFQLALHAFKDEMCIVISTSGGGLRQIRILKKDSEAPRAEPMSVMQGRPYSVTFVHPGATLRFSGCLQLFEVSEADGELAQKARKEEREVHILAHTLAPGAKGEKYTKYTVTLVEKEAVIAKGKIAALDAWPWPDVWPEDSADGTVLLSTNTVVAGWHRVTNIDDAMRAKLKGLKVEIVRLENNQQMVRILKS